MAAKPKHKQATFNEQVAALKEAKVATNPEDYLDAFPSWRVALVELCDPFGWQGLTVAQAATVQARLRAFETMTWREILFKAKGQNHYMPVSELSKEARERLLEIAADVDELMSLRVDKAARVFGIMDGPVCQIVFWDPEHQVYPMNIADN